MKIYILKIDKLYNDEHTSIIDINVELEFSSLYDLCSAIGHFIELSIIEYIPNYNNANNRNDNDDNDNNSDNNNCKNNIYLHNLTINQQIKIFNEELYRDKEKAFKCLKNASVRIEN